MHSLVSVHLLLFFLASVACFGVSIYLIQQNSHSRKGGDDYVRRKRLKTIGFTLLFPAVLLLGLTLLDVEMSPDSGPTIDAEAAAAAQNYVPPVLSRPTESLLVPKDTWKTRMPGATSESRAATTTPSQLGTTPAGILPTSVPAPFPVSTPTPSSAPAPAPADPAHPLSKAQQLDADLFAATAKITANPKDPEAYSTRGNLYAAKREWERAEHDYLSALAIDGANPKTKFNLAEMSFMQKKFDAAKTGFAALEQDPDLGDLAAYKAFLSDMFGGQTDAAAKELDVFNQVGSNASYYFANAAWSINHRKLDDARDWLKSATRIYPSEKFRLYATTLFEMGYLPLPPQPASSN